MKTCQKLAVLTAVAWAAAYVSPIALAQLSEVAPPEVEPSKPMTKHQKLCAMLGLRLGGTYEFRLTGNTDFHYWQIVSMGADGWIQAKDTHSPATWVNLSQIIAITPSPGKPGEERPMKPNRTD